MQGMERIYKIFRCPTKDRVRYAAYMLRGPTMEWWETECRIHPNLEGDIEWEEFRQIFLGKYFPVSMRAKMAWEFQQLRQGSSFVTTYEREFTKLSIFATHLVCDEESRILKFCEGLIPKIRLAVSMARPETYHEAMDLALIVERNIAEVEREEYPKRRGRDEKEYFKKREGPKPNQDFRLKRLREEYKGKVCQVCFKPHSRECYFRGKCYICGQPGHHRNMCP
jgi:hypothetical protein